MNFKTKILSLVIFGLLILPAIFVPVQTGDVLGVNEIVEEADGGETEGEVSALGIVEKEEAQVESGPALKTNEVSSIGSGVRDVAEDEKDSTSDDQKEAYTGLAKYDPKQKVKLATNKFSLGQSLRVVTYEKEHNLVVNQIRQDLEDGVIIIVNRDTFVELGGNLDGENLVEVEIYIE
jgi:hypothetical protein